MEIDDRIRTAVIALLSEEKDRPLTNREISEELRKRGVEFRYRTHHMDILAELARKDLVQRVRQGVYTIPASGQIENTLGTRKTTAEKRGDHRLEARADDHPELVEGDLFEPIALTPMLVKSPTGMGFRLIELR